MLAEQMTQFSALGDQPYLALTTFHRDGRAATAPFRFAQVEDRLYVMAAASAEEIRRIHENAQVEVAPGGLNGQPQGAAQEAMALIVADDETAAAARHALHGKFGLRARLWELTLFCRRERCVYLEITPM